MYTGLAGNNKAKLRYALVKSEMYLAHQIPEISNMHSLIANLEHPFAFSVSDGAMDRSLLLAAPKKAWLLLVQNAKGCSRLAIGECRLLILGA
jgi:hypothetical protein